MASAVAGFAPFAAQAGIVTIAKLGDPAPDGNGKLTNLGRPSINNAGQVAFTSGHFDTLGEVSDENAIYLGSVSGGPLVLIAREGQSPPGGNGTFSSFSFAPGFDNPPPLNNSGDFAFHSRLTDSSGGSLDDRAIYFGSGGPLAQVARGGQTLPDGNGNFYRFTQFTMSSLGQVAFSATVQPTTGSTATDTGIYIGSGTGPTQKVVREGDPSPDGNGTYSTFGVGALSDTGKVAFYSDLLNAVTTNTILSLGSGTAPPILLAREGQIAPDGNGRFTAFGLPAINSSGEVVFNAGLNFTPNPPNDDNAIYRVPGTGGGAQLVIRENQPAPDGNGVFRSFGAPMINTSGRVAIHAVITGSTGGVNDGSGVFLISGGLPRRQVARRNFAAPGGGSFSTMNDSMLALNNGGQVAFYGNFNGGGAGLFIGNGIDLIEIIREGQSLAGGTVAGANLVANTGTSTDPRTSINDHGQVAFQAILTNGVSGVFVFTPLITFQGTVSGNFDDPANWTLGLLPGPFHDLVFNPAANMLLLGPAANRTIKSLRLGGGAGIATLQLQPNVTLTVTGGLTVAANGVLAGEGTVAGNVVNEGLISQGTSPGRIDVTGNLTQSAAGRLLFEIGGTAAGSFDKLAVTQILTLSGALDVVVINNFAPQSNDSFDLLDWGTINGTFATVNLPPLPDGLSWDTANLYSAGLLRVAGGPASAIQAWRQQYFGTPENSGPGANTADPDDDGTVNLLEFATLTNPLTGTALPIELTHAGGNLEFAYTRNKAALGEVTFAVESSETLAPGNWSTAGVTEIIVSDDGTIQQIKATVTAGVMRRFVRLSVTSLAP